MAEVPGTIKCPSCSKQIDPSFVYCPYCGAKQGTL